MKINLKPDYYKYKGENKPKEYFIELVMRG